MRRVIICLALVMGLGLGLAVILSGPALAQQGSGGQAGAGYGGKGTPAGQIEGTVTKVDAQAHTITIDGKTYGVGRRVDLSNIKEGERVKADIRTSHRGTQMVHSLHPLPAAGSAAPTAPRQ